MKREILKREENEDGSYTQIEKITQTPEDGFVSSEELGIKKRKNEYAKGYSKYIVYETNDPEKVYKYLWIIFPLVLLICFAALAFVIFFAAEDSPIRKNFIRTLVVSIIAINLVFIGLLAQWGKRKREAKKKAKSDKPYR